MMRSFLIALLATLAALASPVSAQRLDDTPRTIVMTAFPPEWGALVHSVERPKEYRINGLLFLTGTMQGKGPCC